MSSDEATYNPVSWQRQAKPESKLEYWKEELSELTPLEMVLDKERPPFLTNANKPVEVALNNATMGKLKEICNSLSCDVPSGLLTVFATALCRHTTQAQVIIGYNDLPIVIDYTIDMAFEDMVKVVQNKIKNALRNQLPFEDILTALELNPDTRRNPLFQSVFEFRETPMTEISTSTDHKFEFKLSLEGMSESSELKGSVLYSTDLFEEATANRFAAHFEVLMKNVVDKPYQKMDSFNMLSENEIQELTEWNTTDTDFGPFKRIETLFEAMVESYPHNEALRLDGQSMTYLELNEAATKIAFQLTSIGMESYASVGLILERSFDMFIAILGVLKAGGTIVPVDIAHTPMDRIEYMFEDSQVSFVIIHDTFEVQLEDICDKFPLLKWSEIREVEGADWLNFQKKVELETDHDAIFGIYYTSGTTGRPKGVMNMHRNVFNLAKAFSKYSDVQPTDRILQFASFSFIQSLRQIWPTILSGACLVLCRNPLTFGDVINQERVTKLVITASALGMLNPRSHPSLVGIQLGGEAVPMKLAKAWTPQVRFMVGLGPTELTAHALCHPNITTTMSIGTPHDNVRVYILNASMQIQPMGCVGELCLAGENVARGYLNMPDVTAEKFIQNPFISKKETLYKTGDLAMRWSDGNIRFIGRRDDQVKIHGYRIELSEIQRAIEGAEGVEKAAVLVKNEQIAAYVTPNTLVEADLRDYLGSKLPSYMVPSHIVRLERFPLNKNGKLDRAALPDPMTIALEMDDKERKKVASHMESITSAAFRIILNIDPNRMIYANDSFFDLGGSSLTVAMLARHLSESTKTDISIINIFDLKTVEEIAKFMEKELKKKSSGNASYWQNAPDVDINFIADEMDKPMNGFVYSFLQCLAVMVIVFIQISPALACILAFREVVYTRAEPIWQYMIVLPFVLFGGAIFQLFLTFIVKWVCIGRLKPGVHNMYTCTFLRWWLNRKLMASPTFWLWIFNETPFYPMWFRLLGATIGSSAHMDMCEIDEPDLVTIGNNFIGQYESGISSSEIIERKLVLRRVVIGDDVFIGKRAFVLPGSNIPSNVELCGSSSVDSTSEIKSAERWSGFPAKHDGVRSADQSSLLPAFFHETSYYFLQLVNIYALLFLLQWPFIALAQSGIWVYENMGFEFVPGYIGMFGPVTVTAAYLALIFIVKWLLIGFVTPGVLYSGRFFFLRRWILDRLLSNPIYVYLQPTVLSYCSTGPSFYRMLGVRIGEETWMAPPVFDSGLDLVRFGNHPHMGQQNVFFTALVSSEGVRYLDIMIGNNVTLGQRSMISPGVTLGSNTTIGACTFMPVNFKLKDNQTACGSPMITFETTADDATIGNQLQKVVNMELRKSLHGGPSFRGSARRSRYSSRAFSSDRQPSVLSDGRQLSVGTGRGSSFRNSNASMLSSGGGSSLPKQYQRSSLFSQTDPKGNNRPKVDQGWGSWFCVTSFYHFFSPVVLLTKLFLPLLLWLGYTTIFEILILIFGLEDIGDGDSALALIYVIPLVYAIGSTWLLLWLYVMRKLQLLNFRSGIMDYWSIGFYHWYIFTDILFGWIQMIMSPMAGTGIYISFFRLMGASLGDDVYIDIPGGLREVNNIIMEDGAVLLTRFIYAHYIDHGKLQFAPVIIGADAVINKDCMVMPLTTYEDNVSIRAYSSTIKGQVFGANKVFQGHPASKTFDVLDQPQSRPSMLTTIQEESTIAESFVEKRRSSFGITK